MKEHFLITNQLIFHLFVDIESELVFLLPCSLQMRLSPGCQRCHHSIVPSLHLPCFHWVHLSTEIFSSYIKVWTCKQNMFDIFHQWLNQLQFHPILPLCSGVKVYSSEHDLITTVISIRSNLNMSIIMSCIIVTKILFLKKL